MKAMLCVPQIEPYPYRSLKIGLEASGYDVGTDMNADLLMVWSPWNRSHRQSVERLFRSRGCPVIVVENGWLSPLEEPYYQLARDGWNGTGTYPVGGPERFDSWGVELDGWRYSGAYALIIGQRGHPDDIRTAPPNWHLNLKLGGSVVRRPRECNRALRHDLEGASEVHVWSSNAASWAIVAGRAVVQHGPNLMVSELASRPGEPLKRPARRPVLERLAWAQWTEAEIMTGEPIRRLL